MSAMGVLNALMSIWLVSATSAGLRGVSEGDVKHLSLLSAQERAAMKESLRAECKTSAAGSSHRPDKCWDLCKGSAGCVSVCDELKEMICPQSDVPAMATDNSAEVAAAAAAAASSTIQDQVRQAIGQVKDLAWEASVDAQKQIHQVMQKTIHQIKDAAHSSIPSTAAKAAVKASTAEAAATAESVAKVAAAAAVSAAKQEGGR